MTVYQNLLEMRDLLRQLIAAGNVNMAGQLAAVEAQIAEYK